jgi:hypothetical protein
VLTSLRKWAAAFVLTLATLPITLSAGVLLPQLVRPGVPGDHRAEGGRAYRAGFLPADNPYRGTDAAAAGAWADGWAAERLSQTP